MPYFDVAAWAAIIAHEDTELDGPASAADITDFERHYKVLLPPSHKEFLLRANGGVVGLARVFGANRSDALDLAGQIESMRAYIEQMADGPVLPFASDWGGSYFCYDLRHTANEAGYPVLLWNHEYSEEPEYRPYLWSLYAENFPGFIKRVLRT